MSTRVYRVRRVMPRHFATAGAPIQSSPVDFTAADRRAAHCAGNSCGRLDHSCLRGQEPARLAVAVLSRCCADPSANGEVQQIHRSPRRHGRPTLRGATAPTGAEWQTWAADNGYADMPAAPEGISRYLTFLAGHGAKVGTMSRRLSGIRFAHRMRDLPDPTASARVIAVWEGIRRTHGAPPEQASPLMPPELWDVLDRCPVMRSWKAKKRPAEPDLAGLRDLGAAAGWLRGRTPALRAGGSHH